MTFEEKSKRLEEIVLKLEKDNIGLEEGTKLFEEGVALAKDCYEMIQTTKGKVSVIKKDLNTIIEGEE